MPKKPDPAKPIKPQYLSYTDGAVGAPEVMSLTKLSSSALYRLIRQGDFPKPGKIQRKTFWPRAVVLKWIDDRYAASN